MDTFLHTPHRLPVRYTPGKIQVLSTMEGLSEAQRSQYAEFTSITGLEISDDETVAKVIGLLDHHDYNLNNAVLAYFDTGLDLPPQPETPIAEASGASTVDSSVTRRSIQEDFAFDLWLPRLPKAPRLSNQWQFELGIHLSKRQPEEPPQNAAPLAPRPSFPWVLLLIIPKAFSFLYTFIKILLGFNKVPSLSGIRHQFDWDKLDELHDPLLGVDTLDFKVVTKDFNAAHERAQHDFDFLVIFLVDDASEDFLARIFEHDRFKALLAESSEYRDTTVYVGNVTLHPEAFEVARAYRARGFPFACISANVTNNPAVMSSMSMVFKTHLLWEEAGEAQIPRLVRGLAKSMSDYNAQLVTRRFDKKEMEFSRFLKQKQDEAYLESLQQDQVKKEKKESDRKAKELKEELRTHRLRSLAHFVTSNYFDAKIQDLPASDVVRVSIKLPHGKRVIQKFSRTEPLQSLYIFVETLMMESTEDETHETTVADFCEVHSFAFELCKPMPRLALPAISSSIEEFGKLATGDTILVEYFDESDGSEVEGDRND